MFYWELFSTNITFKRFLLFQEYIINQSYLYGDCRLSSKRSYPIHSGTLDNLINNVEDTLILLTWNVLNLDDFSKVSEARKAQVTFAEKPQIKNWPFSKNKKMIDSKSEKAFNGIVVNWTCKFIKRRYLKLRLQSLILSSEDWLISASIPWCEFSYDLSAYL